MCMSESVRNENAMPQMLFPFDPDQFWQRVRLICPEISNLQRYIFSGGGHHFIISKLTGRNSGKSTFKARITRYYWQHKF
ncbi:hypothetical protein CLV51_105364 [Chitinophaga niastensis]|uniref:Uncharacterized protein n=1 Tax=Chitinophaga niastensis TaxID=536980 RepID=A0A2P8HFI6_CHINA|nr:hypothetical protein CLV51_105364 [Chitinophaga niastensis]